MISHQLDHPDEAKLQAFALGKVAVDEVDVIQSHLRECPSCCKVLDDVQGDTFVALVRDAETIANLVPPGRSIDASEQPGEVRSGGETQGAATEPAEAPTMPGRAISSRSIGRITLWGPWCGNARRRADR